MKIKKFFQNKKNNYIYIIAEACDNHFGNIQNAIKMISEAKKAGEKRVKNKWNPIPRYITIEISVRPKSDVAREDPHKMIHTLLICYRENWHELKFVKKRTDKMCEHYSQYDDVHGRSM